MLLSSDEVEVEVLDSEEVELADVVDSGVLVNSVVDVGFSVGIGAAVVGAGGRTTLREMVAPQSARGVPFGQQPASVQ